MYTIAIIYPMSHYEIFYLQKEPATKKDDAGIQLWTLYAPGELRICFNITTATPKTDNSKFLEKKILSIHSVLATCIKVSHMHHPAWDLHGVRPTDVSFWDISWYIDIPRYRTTSLWKKIKQESCLVASVTETRPIDVKQQTQSIWGTPQMCKVTRRACRSFLHELYQSVAKWHQICTLTHASHSRFVPCLAGMVMIAMERLPNALVKMCLNASGIVVLLRAVQPRKASAPIWVTDSPKVMLAREVQPRKAPCPIWVTDSPKVTLAREVQFEKAPSPMWVTDSPKVMLARELQPRKAPESHRLTQGDARQRGAEFKGTHPNVSHRLTQGDARQRGAASKGHVANVSHRRTQDDARQRGTVLKGHVANVSHRRTQDDARQRGASVKGTVPNLSDRLTQGDARQRGTVLKGNVTNVSHRRTQGDARQRGAA